jgi:hypothetical protein
VKQALSLLGALALATSVRADEPACRAQVRIEPERAVVGQQVLYRAHVLRRDEVSEVEWEEPPAFPNARAEALPPEPGSDERDEGVLYHAQDEQRAVFPEREGRLLLGAGVLRCRSSGGATQQLRVPAARLDVRPFPAEGRPPDFAGLVGPVLLSLTVTPERVALGQSLRVALMARGPGNLWQLDDSVLRRALGEVEVFARPSELALERGRGLFVRQHLALDAVPRAAGRLVVAPVRIPYFDPDAGVYRVAATEEVPVVVEERVAQGAVVGERAPARAPTPSGVRASRVGWVPWAVAACALAGGAGVLRWRRRPADAAAEALAEAAQARACGDRAGELAAQARALRAALARDLPGVGALAVEELEARAERPAARDAAALLAALERARFSPGATPPDADAITRAVRALGAGRGVRATFLLCALGVALAGGCASDPMHRDEPMTPAKLEATLREQAGDIETVEGQLRFSFGGVRMVCVYDVHADRMRIVAAVAEESGLTVASARILLQANFSKTFDSRYALHDGVLYAVYLHPLSTLDPRELDAALPQVARLVRNFGTTFSAGSQEGR